MCAYKAVREIRHSFNLLAFGMVLLGIVSLCHHSDEDHLYTPTDDGQKFAWHHWDVPGN